jgi:hypothetical protein
MILDPCHCQPVEVPDYEHIARGVFYTFHVKRNGRLKWQAFKPDVGESDISVMRLPFLSPGDCKSRAKQMETLQKEYRGFALFHVQALRSADFDVKDSRIVFCGHADLVLGEAHNPKEFEEPPTDQLDSLRLEDACRRLKGLACLRIDPQPQTFEWPESLKWLPLEDCPSNN